MGYHRKAVLAAVNPEGHRTLAIPLGKSTVNHLKNRHCREEQQDGRPAIWRSPHAGVAEAFPIFDQKTSESIEYYFTTVSRLRPVGLA